MYVYWGLANRTGRGCEWRRKMKFCEGERPEVSIDQGCAWVPYGFRFLKSSRRVFG